MIPGLFRLSDVAFVALAAVAALILTVTPLDSNTLLGNLGESPTTVDSPSYSASATGGSGLKSYSWSYVSGDPAVSALSPSSSSTSFRWSGSPTPAGVFSSAVFRCTVTDSSGSASVDVTVSFELYSGPIP